MAEQKPKNEPERIFHPFLSDKGRVYLRGPVDIIIGAGQGVVIQGDESYKLRDEPDSTPRSALEAAIQLFGEGLVLIIDQPMIYANPQMIRCVRLKAGYPYLHIGGQDYRVYGASLDDVLEALDPSYANAE